MPPNQNPALPPPLAFSLPFTQRINPTPDVQQQVMSAIEACTKWQPVSVQFVKGKLVQVATGEALPLETSTTAQVCNVLDRWPLMSDKQTLGSASVGVGLAIAAAVACITVAAVFRGALGIMPLAPVASRFVARAVGGALCGVGCATFSLLLSLQEFVAPTPEQTVHKAFLSWKGTASWVAAVCAVLFVLSEVPSVWRRQTSRAATR